MEKPLSTSTSALQQATRTAYIKAKQADKALVSALWTVAECAESLLLYNDERARAHLADALEDLRRAEAAAKAATNAWLDLARRRADARK